MDRVGEGRFRIVSGQRISVDESKVIILSIMNNVAYEQKTHLMTQNKRNSAAPKVDVAPPRTLTPRSVNAPVTAA